MAIESEHVAALTPALLAVCIRGESTQIDDARTILEEMLGRDLSSMGFGVDDGVGDLLQDLSTVLAIISRQSADMVVSLSERAGLNPIEMMTYYAARLSTG